MGRWLLFFTVSYGVSEVAFAAMDKAAAAAFLAWRTSNPSAM
jgi:hypothetical protein